MSRPAAGPSWGELRPTRDCPWDEDHRGVTLHTPRFGHGFVGRRIERWFRPRPLDVRLDDLGTFVWKRCDGECTVADLADALRAEFGERVEPARDRLVTFLTHLARARVLTLRP